MILPGLYDIFQERWGKFQTCHITSDTHFSDEELAAGIKNRPTDDLLVKLINSKVGKKDLLIHLGDVGDIEYAKQLRGYKVLICGNHDSGKTNYADVFDEIYTGPLLIGEKILLSHEPIPNITWAVNLHGHDHCPHKTDKYHYNFCLDATNYLPINFNQWLKEGHLSKIETIHRITIDKATTKKRNKIDKK